MFTASFLWKGEDLPTGQDVHLLFVRGSVAGSPHREGHRRCFWRWLWVKNNEWGEEKGNRRGLCVSVVHITDSRPQPVKLWNYIVPQKSFHTQHLIKFKKKWNLVLKRHVYAHFYKSLPHTTFNSFSLKAECKYTCSLLTPWTQCWRRRNQANAMNSCRSGCVCVCSMYRLQPGRTPTQTSTPGCTFKWVEGRVQQVLRRSQTDRWHGPSVGLSQSQKLPCKNKRNEGHVTWFLFPIFTLHPNPPTRGERLQTAWMGEQQEEEAEEGQRRVKHLHGAVYQK